MVFDAQPYGSAAGLGGGQQRGASQSLCVPETATCRRQHPVLRTDSRRSLGIYVIKADSHDEAVAIAGEDPMHTSKVRRAEVIDWEVHQIMGAGFKD